MCMSLFLIWKQNAGEDRNREILVFMIQLILNFCWSFIFFHQLGLALVEILLLGLSIFLMILIFYKIRPVAAYINILYLLWVTFATVLNATYYFLNRI
jgi:translocator protein